MSTNIPSAHGHVHVGAGAADVQEPVMRALYR